MQIKDILNKKKTLSFEIFPPKKELEDLNKVFKTIDCLKELQPDFISVTYGALGNNRSSTIEIANYIQNNSSIVALAHLTGGPSSYQEIEDILVEFKKQNIDNILILRGDAPIDCSVPYLHNFKYASELHKYISQKNIKVCLAGACYPEGHSESSGLLEDLKYIKLKEENGADFFISQMFFDNNYFYRLIKEARKMGIKSPILAGIMPVINSKQITKMTKMCGVTIPLELKNLLERYNDDPQAMREIGINYAAHQIIDLLSNDIDGIHIYTMNNANLAKEIVGRIKHIIDKEIHNAKR